MTRIPAPERRSALIEAALRVVARLGITQATNALALSTCCDVPQSVTVDYSTAQQLITTAWNILFALVLVVLIFGWTGGKSLVLQSYEGAKEKAAEQKEQRAAKKEAKRASAREKSTGFLHRRRDEDKAG